MAMVSLHSSDIDPPMRLIVPGNFDGSYTSITVVSDFAAFGINEFHAAECEARQQVRRMLAARRWSTSSSGFFWRETLAHYVVLDLLPSPNEHTRAHRRASDFRGDRPFPYVRAS
jgi:hypothetical protein